MDSFRMEDSLGALISKTHWFMKTYFTKMIRENGLNVTPEQWAVLNTLFRYPGISQTEVAQKSGKDKTNITRILDVLEKNDCIKRESDKQDRRMYRIYLTEKGEMTLKALYPIADRVNKTSSKNMSEEELRNFKKFLNSISDTIKELL